MLDLVLTAAWSNVRRVAKSKVCNTPYVGVQEPGERFETAVGAGFEERLRELMKLTARGILMDGVPMDRIIAFQFRAGAFGQLSAGRGRLAEDLGDF